VTALDVAVLVWVGIWAVLGAARGMTEQLLSLAGLAVGAIAGSRLASELLPGGRESRRRRAGGGGRGSRARSPRASTPRSPPFDPGPCV
jgi:hypothetical protein